MLSDRIVKARTKAKLTQEEFAKKLKIGKRTLIDYEKGISEPKASTAFLIAEICNIDVVWLLSGNETSLERDTSSSISLDFYPHIHASAGYGVTNHDESKKKIELSKSFLRALGLKEYKHLDLISVYGDSMEPFVANGEFVIVERALEAKNNDVIIANVNGEIYVKKLIKDPFGKWVRLTSLNELYGDLELKGEELQYFNIVGIVRAKIRPM